MGEIIRPHSLYTTKKILARQKNIYCMMGPRLFIKEVIFLLRLQRRQINKILPLKLFFTELVQNLLLISPTVPNFHNFFDITYKIQCYQIIDKE